MKIKISSTPTIDELVAAVSGDGTLRIESEADGVVFYRQSVNEWSRKWDREDGYFLSFEDICQRTSSSGIFLIPV